MKKIDYGSYRTWLDSLAVDGSQTGKGLSASRITQAHRLVGAVLDKACVKVGIEGLVPHGLRYTTA